MKKAVEIARNGRCSISGSLGDDEGGTRSLGDETYWEGWFVTTDKPRLLSEERDSYGKLTVMHVMILEQAQGRGVNW